jgi:AcrR family transcriptional regulator
VPTDWLTVNLESRSSDTRQRIIEAVWDVLAQNGLSGLTVRLVGRKAGISHAMVHYYFSAKDELLLAVVEYARGYWIHPMEDIVLGPGTPADKLEAVVTWMAEPATRDVMRVHRQLLSQSEWDEDLRKAMAAEYARWRAAFVELFRQLEEAGALTDGTDVKLLGAAFATLSDHLVGKQALDPSLDTEAIMREALRPFLRSPLKPAAGKVKPARPAIRAGRARRWR